MNSATDGTPLETPVWRWKTIATSDSAITSMVDDFIEPADRYDTR